MSELDDRGIPRVDPERIPRMVVDGSDWRAALDALREEYPFFRVGDDPTIWVTRYEAAREVLRNWELFSSRGKGAGVYHLPSSEDPPVALDFRRALMPEFSPAKVRAWEPYMRTTAQGLIDRFADRGRADYVTEFAQLFFPYIGAEWFGVPHADRDQLTRWEHEVFHEPDDTDQRMVDMRNDAMGSIMDYIDYLLDLKTAAPDDGFVSFVLGMEVDGKPLTREQAKSVLGVVTLGSGHTVSAHLVYVMKHLAEHPADRQRVVANPAAVDLLGEELLRLYSLFGGTRVVTRDEEFHGVQLRAGDDVFIMYGLANRDPREFGEGVELDRKPNPHLGFNHGVHQCIGMHWAKLSRNIAINEWHARIPDYSLDEGAQIVDQVYAGVGPHHLPLTWPGRAD